MCHNLVAGERYNKSTLHPAYEEMLGQAKWGVQEFTPPVGMWDFTSEKHRIIWPKMNPILNYWVCGYQQQWMLLPGLEVVSHLLLPFFDGCLAVALSFCR